MTDSDRRPVEEPAPLKCPDCAKRVVAYKHLSRCPQCGREWPVAAAPVPLCPPSDPNFTGGLDPVEYLERLHEGTLEESPTFLLSRLNEAHATIRELESERSSLAAEVARLREECAQVCEQRAKSLADGKHWSAANEAHKCAMAIRTFAAPNGVEVAVRSAEPK